MTDNRTIWQLLCDLMGLKLAKWGVMMMSEKQAVDFWRAIGSIKRSQ